MDSIFHYNIHYHKSSHYYNQRLHSMRDYYAEARNVQESDIIPFLTYTVACHGVILAQRFQALSVVITTLSAVYA